MKTTTQYGITHGDLVIELMKAYHGHVGLLGSAGAARAVMDKAAQMHKASTRPTLAIGLAQRSDAWTLLEESAATYSSAVTQALSLSGRHAQCSFPHKLMAKKRTEVPPGMIK